jgi:acyl dehydratase
MIAFAEQGCRFLKPVLLNDTIHTEFEVSGLERKRDRGVVRLAVTVVNQRAEAVLSGHHVYLVRCR